MLVAGCIVCIHVLQVIFFESCIARLKHFLNEVVYLNHPWACYLLLELVNVHTNVIAESTVPAPACRLDGGDHLCLQTPHVHR